MTEDGLPDDRVTCNACKHCRGYRWHCVKYEVGISIHVPLRCVGFDPLPGAEDQRTGATRWPNMLKEIEEARRLDAEFAKGGRR